MTNEEKIKKWLAGELSDSERKEFESSEEFEEIDKLLKAVKNFKAPDYDKEKERINLQKRLAPSFKTNFYQRISPVLKIAAVFIAMLTIGYFLYTNLNTSLNKQNWIVQQEELFLPDSSSVILNSASKIRFSKKQWSKERFVELKGEAFFRVKKGKSFSVKTEQGTVTVLGTKFSVKDRDKYYEVFCYSGSVKVVSSENTKILKPGQAYRILNGVEEKLIETNQKKPTWLIGESSFVSTPLIFVFKEFERQYNVKIEVEGIDLNQLFTGSFTNKKMETALKSISIPVNLHYEIKSDKIIMTLEKQ